MTFDVLGGRSQETRRMTERPRGEGILIALMVLALAGQALCTILLVLAVFPSGGGQ